MSRLFTRSDHGLELTLILCLALATPVTSNAETPSSIMSRAMIAMMDTMGDLAHEFKGKSNWSFGNSNSPYSGWSGPGGSPWSTYSMPGYGPGWPGGPPLQSPLPGMGGVPPLMSPRSDPAGARSPVDGIWLGQSGEIVLVMYGHFRIYASAETYRDGQFEIDGDRLAMYDPESGYIMEFDYLLNDGRMIMRSETGAIMLFKQLPIPIPPYSLFADSPSSYQ